VSPSSYSDRPRRLIPGTKFGGPTKHSAFGGRWTRLRIIRNEYEWTPPVPATEQGAKFFSLRKSRSRPSSRSTIRGPVLDRKVVVLFGPLACAFFCSGISRNVGKRILGRNYVSVDHGAVPARRHETRWLPRRESRVPPTLNGILIVPWMRRASFAVSVAAEPPRGRKYSRRRSASRPRA
jgi:hypothetical protein